MPQPTLFDTTEYMEPVTLDDIRRLFPGDVRVRDNWRNDKPPDEWDDWNNALKGGRGYMVGSRVPMPEFLRTHRSKCNDWQQAVWNWCILNPRKALYLETHDRSRPRDWHCCKRGEYVDFGLPHHDAGGERNWISLDGVSKVLVNVD